MIKLTNPLHDTKTTADTQTSTHDMESAVIYFLDVPWITGVSRLRGEIVRSLVTSLAVVDRELKFETAGLVAP